MKQLHAILVFSNKNNANETIKFVETLLIDLNNNEFLYILIERKIIKNIPIKKKTKKKHFLIYMYSL